MKTCISFFLILFLVVVSAKGYDGVDDDEQGFPGNSIATFKDLPDYSDFEDDLTFSYYHTSCPVAEAIIQRKVDEWAKKDDTLAPSLIRLQYHDCVVRGCDASILLDYDGSERSANQSKSLRGFKVIDDIKAELEKKCPRTVSCSDILVGAVRDAIRIVGGPFYMVPYGRKDGRVSKAKDTESLPTGREKITDLVEFFQSMGLNVLDLVVLSGAHTIGRTSCGSVQERLYNFNGTAGRSDPSIDPKYLNFLKRKCRWASEFVDFDGITPKNFNNEYYKNLQRNMGLLSTDQMLNKDSRTSVLVSALASQPEVFYSQFAASMVKLGKIQDPSSEGKGEVRLNCNYINA
ncbi:peroxidase 7-like [Apium graveolens]|uniref:peroxidase 7-like n=1 Tax=Apium graveolens TaxID=4045 RepID=UPI003D7989B4